MMDRRMDMHSDGWKDGGVNNIPIAFLKKAWR